MVLPIVTKSDGNVLDADDWNSIQPNIMPQDMTFAANAAATITSSDSGDSSFGASGVMLSKTFASGALATGTVMVAVNCEGIYSCAGGNPYTYFVRIENNNGTVTEYLDEAVAASDTGNVSHADQTVGWMSTNKSYIISGLNVGSENIVTIRGVISGAGTGNAADDAVLYTGVRFIVGY